MSTKAYSAVACNLPCQGIKLDTVLEDMLSAARQDCSAAQYACGVLRWQCFHCYMQVYSGTALETAFIGKESPGPMGYDQHCSGIGRQVGTIVL